MYSPSSLIYLSLWACTFTTVQSHSWPEALNLINNQGTIKGPTGYVRNFLQRGGPGFKGDETDSFQKTQVVQGAKVCMNRESSQTQSPGFPRLQVTPGAKVALRYAENGHVSVREPGRPDAGGPVYIFGTTEGTKNPLLTDVMKWNAQGTGGDKTGKLITTQNFDDGRCFENNNSPIASQRKVANSIGSSLALPNFSGLPCQNDFSVPDDAPVGKLYTIYWVWNFTFPDNQGVEIFSNCLDLEVHAASAANKQVAKDDFNHQQPAISAAVPAYFAKLAAGPAATPSAAQLPAPAAVSPSPEPASGSGTLLSEASDGGVYAPTPSPSHAKAGHHVTKTVYDALETIYVLVKPSPSAAAAASASPQSPSPSPSQSVAQSPAQSPQSSPSPTTLQSSTKASATAQTAQSLPSNHLNIPLLSIGPSGAGRVAMASLAPLPSKKPQDKRSQPFDPPNPLRFRRHFF